MFCINYYPNNRSIGIAPPVSVDKKTAHLIVGTVARSADGLAAPVHALVDGRVAGLAVGRLAGGEQFRAQ